MMPRERPGQNPLNWWQWRWRDARGFLVTMVRQKHHQKLTGYEVFVEADQAERPPQVFTTIRLRHVLTGIGIEKQAVEQAIQLSEQKYCSVGAMLKGKARLVTTYEINEEPVGWLKPETAPEQVCT
jgi:hypothetical protein